ncbi:MAG: protein kinase [Campylobacterota bacterium]|nr:protein kinase [Campylobacterota bacterium]
MNFNTNKYNIIKAIDENKILILENKDTKDTVVAKQGINSKKEYGNLQTLKDIKSIPTIVEYENSILYTQYKKNTITLTQFIKNNKNISLNIFYNIAIKIMKIVKEIHLTGLIHKDINTNNILINTDTKELYFIDFELSSSIKEKIDINQNIQELSGHISFISPEQTGRVNREVDFRSDFYSLGVVFYNLLTSRVPLEAEDLIGVIHQHITKQPLNPTVINKNVPKLLSNQEKHPWCMNFINH